MAKEDRHSSYMEELLDAVIRHEKDGSSFVFQTERIGLKNEAEIAFIAAIDPAIRKTIELKEDELTVHAAFPERIRRFEDVLLEDEKTKWILAGRLVETAQEAGNGRLHPVICPENIVFSSGLEPHFLHYGLTGTLPPSKSDPERVWLETRAAAAFLVDGKYSFSDYLRHHETLALGTQAGSIMNAESPEALLDYVSRNIRLIDLRAREQLNVPRKKWRITKGLSIGLGILLIPAIIFTLYTFIYEKPKNEAITRAHESYLLKKYSDAVTELSDYKVQALPYVTLYELADSYVINERLTETQKENIRSNITLKTDEDYLKYWIHIGRDEAEEAVDLARSMEDPVLLAYGLAMRQEEIRSDHELSGEEKQDMIGEIDQELGEIKDAMEEVQQAEEEAGQASDQPRGPSAEEKSGKEKTEDGKEDKAGKAEENGETPAKKAGDEPDDGKAS